MSVRTYGDLAAAEQRGQVHVAHLRKVPSQASTAGQWVDLSMASGNPVPNYYASDPLVGASLASDRGLFFGDDVAPATRYLKEMVLCTPTAGLVGAYKLLDYLLYYPFVDLDTTDQQVLETPTPLARYADGDGVRLMLVAQVPQLGGGSLSYEYVNQDGVTRTSPVFSCNTTADSIATVVTSQQGAAAGGQPFAPLADGDTGIRRITAINPLALNGGLVAAVLVRPLADLGIREINVPDERVLVTERPRMPIVLDGAYLNLIVNCAATVAAGQVAGRATFVWD